MERTAKKYNTTAFYWQSDLATGRGVMFYCKDSAKVMLIQFIGKCDEQIDHAAVTLFNSLNFNNPETEQLWCIYDMKATLPGSMALESFEFKPGRFNICLTDQTETIDLYRFSPADVILKDCTLREFSKELFEDDIKKLGLSIASWIRQGVNLHVWSGKKPFHYETCTFKAEFQTTSLRADRDPLYAGK